MVTNLSGSNIQDTYQQLIHTTDRINFYTGTGSVVGLVIQNSHPIFQSVTASGNISASGDVYGSHFYVDGHKILDYHASSDSILLGETTQKLNVHSPTTFVRPIIASIISSSGEIIGLINGGTF